MCFFSPHVKNSYFKERPVLHFSVLMSFSSILNSFSSLLLLSLRRNPMCRTVTAKWLASCRTHWVGTAAPPCLSVALHRATMMQRPNPRWCLANGNMDLCVWYSWTSALLCKAKQNPVMLHNSMNWVILTFLLACTLTVVSSSNPYFFMLKYKHALPHLIE